MKKLEQLTEEEFKKEFLKWFDETTWDSLTMLGNLQELEEMLCDYLRLELIPVINGAISEDSRYYPKGEYIIISDEKLKDKVEAQKCLIHELRHYYQYKCVSTNNQAEPMLEQWKKELEIYDTLAPDIQLCTFLEIDAYAFTKVIMKQWFKKDIIHFDDEYEKALNLYIKKYLS